MNGRIRVEIVSGGPGRVRVRAMLVEDVDRHGGSDEVHRFIHEGESIAEALVMVAVSILAELPDLGVREDMLKGFDMESAGQAASMLASRYERRGDE